MDRAVSGGGSSGSRTPLRKVDVSFSVPMEVEMGAAVSGRRRSTGNADFRGSLSLDGKRDSIERRTAQSWCPGLKRQQLRLPMKFESADLAGSSRALNGIERSVNTQMPTYKERANFNAIWQRRSMNSSRRTFVHAFVNSKSGGQVGEAIMKALQENLGQMSDKALGGQVCDLSAKGEPENTIKAVVRKVLKESGSGTDRNDYRLLVCGGDGTVTWILTALEQCEELTEMNRTLVLSRLPVAIVPLGTGNDLARSLGWGGSLRRVSDILNYLLYMGEAKPVLMDQWMVVIRPHERLPPDHKLRTCGSHPQLICDEETRKQLLQDLQDEFGGRIDNEASLEDEVFAGYWQNYYSVGMDARITGEVEKARQAGFGRCLFRWGMGKLCYGWKAFLYSCSRVITQAIQHLTLTNIGGEDSQTVSLACKGSAGRIRQLMFLNINSYSAGLQVLPSPEQADAPPNPSDEIMEVLSVRNVAGACGIFFGCTRPKYWASCERAAFSLNSSQSMQADGEPWFLDCGADVLLQHHRKVTMLRAPDKSRNWSKHIVPGFWDTPVQAP
mmetsp:Transcript_14918/g.32210  ORF Transcript_14918/g.32210 Transcript_14918/m.32210 type:complete len:556 (+) Transcript_14918:51-1718(+)